MTVDQARIPGRVDALAVGGGMAGLAAAMVIAESGTRPLVIERGLRSQRSLPSPRHRGRGGIRYALYNGWRVGESRRPGEDVEV